MQGLHQPTEHQAVHTANGHVKEETPLGGASLVGGGLVCLLWCLINALLNVLGSSIHCLRGGRGGGGGGGGGGAGGGRGGGGGGGPERGQGGRIGEGGCAGMRGPAKRAATRAARVERSHSKDCKPSCLLQRLEPSCLLMMHDLAKERLGPGLPRHVWGWGRRAGLARAVGG